MEPPNSRKKFIIGNWKMHTTAAEAVRLAKAVVDGVGMEKNVIIAICPPFTCLALVGEILKGSNVSLGAQNLYPAAEGAFTGEISPKMLLEAGCRYVILGHSERRHVLGESDAFINRKVLMALGTSLNVILCVGETLDERNSGQTEAVLDRQIAQGLAGVSADKLPRLIVAYEPVWAIGTTGHHARPPQVQEAHDLIRHHFGKIFGGQAAQSLPIQYGGSVKPDNAAGFLSQEGVDGVLLGGAALIAEEFIAIVHAGVGELQTEEKSK